MIKELAILISEIDVTAIYTAVGQIANVVAVSFTPGLLMIAIYVRICRDSLDTFSGGSTGKWARAVRDMIIYGAVCASYFAICALITKYANGIYSWSESIGSLKLLTEDMSAVTKAITKKSDDSQGVAGAINTISNFSPQILTTSFLYYASLVLASLFIAILKIAHALCFGIAFIWGLFAIPISVSENIKILRGWALLFGFAIVWPIIQAILVAIVRLAVVPAINKIIVSSAAPTGMITEGSDLVLTVLNLLFCATVLASPYLASALVSNAPAATAVVSPFVSTAVAGAAMAFQGAKFVGGKVIGGTGAAAGGAMNKAKGSFGSGGGQPSGGGTGGGGASQENNGGGGAGAAAGGGTAAAQPGVGEQGGGPSIQVPSTGATATAAPDNSSETQQRKQRRGVIINQNKSNS